MIFSVTRSVLPDDNPLTIDEIKGHLRVRSTDEDALIHSLMDRATELLETQYRRAFVTQTRIAYADYFPTRTFEVPAPPLASVTGVYYTEDGEAEAEVDSADYAVDTTSEPGRIALDTGVSWPAVTLTRVNGFRVEYVCGVAREDVPEKIKQSISLLVGHWYINREATGSATGEVWDGVAALMSADRVW